MSGLRAISVSGDFRRGDWVEIRALDEILATLDAEGKLEGMPFMPEMAQHCGRRVRVFRRADKTCVEGQRMRRLRNTVLLEGLRCDGSGHDGCQRGCMMFWKAAWLKRIAGAPVDPPPTTGVAPSGHGATAANGSLAHLKTKVDSRYVCQSTELATASEPISRWNPWPYVQDFFVGEITVGGFCRMVGRMAANHLRRLLRRMPRGVLKTTPRGTQQLRPGSWVTVKSRAEIEGTLDTEGKNRGLSLELEMLDHCGQRHQVAYPVQRIILEQTGEMLRLSDTVALEGLTCRGTCAKNCPRSSYYYWREIWLNREDDSGANGDERSTER